MDSYLRRKAVEKAKITKARNNALRQSVFGRLLLTLERCSTLNGSEGEAGKRRLELLLGDLSYACKLADEAGIENGWTRDGAGSFWLVFGLGIGDIVLPTFDHRLATNPFSRPQVISDYLTVLAREIDQALIQIRSA